MARLLYDKDNLTEAFSDGIGKRLLSKYGFSSVNDLCATLIEQKSQGAEYVIGLPGVGKSTYAIETLKAKPISTKADMIQLLSLDFEDMVFVSSGVKDEIAKNASHITLLHTSENRVSQQRQQRNSAIERQNSLTAFGRKAGTTDAVSTDNRVNIARLKTDYAEKSDILVYTSNDATDFSQYKMIPFSRLNENKKYET